MKRIGILTRYYKSENYGGVLQAYALNIYLRKQGKICETINYDFNRSRDLRYLQHNNHKIKASIKISIRKLRDALNRFKIVIMCPRLIMRFQKFADFRNNMINHSDKVYTLQNIHQTEDLFDLFITGSDRVWQTTSNTSLIDSIFFLSFASEGKIAAYSASATNEVLEDKEIDYYKKNLCRFDYISVREKSLALMLSALMPEKHIVNTLDPVFLLDAEEWKSIQKNNEHSERYVFVYLLNPNEIIHYTIETFAKQMSLKIAYIPYAGGKFNKEDKLFGDIRISDAGPLDFLAYIQNAEIIITDSFHCCAFSILFNKEFFVFNRNNLNNKNTYGSRIRNIFEMFSIDNNRIINLGEEIPLNIAKINYGLLNIRMKELRKLSQDYLHTVITSC